MFCRQCGNKLTEGQKFCQSCGCPVSAPAQQVQQQPIQQAPVQPVYQQPEQQPVYQQPVQQGGHAVWVLHATHKVSLLKGVQCYVVFWPDRVILAHLTSELQKAESAKVSAQIKAEGLGFFKGSAAMMKHWATYGRKYETMSEQAILAEEPSNMVIPYISLSEVSFHCYSESTDFEDNSTSVYEGKLHLKLANGETVKLTHHQENAAFVKDTLTNLFGYKLKYKR